MSIHAWILTSLLIGAVPPGDPAPVPQLEKGFETTWRGKFTEAILRPNVRAFREYDVETRLFVLDTRPTGSDIALFTSVRLKPELQSMPIPPAIVRLELAHLDPTGKMMLLPPESLTVAPNERKLMPLPLMPMEGLPTFETGFFLSFPSGKVQSRETWSVPEDKRPSLNYRLDGMDSIRGSRCYKILAKQETEDWSNPRPDSAAWRRNETIWVSAKRGYAARLERIIEKRDPQTGELGFRSKLDCEQINGLHYSDRLYTERREEIVNAALFAADFERLLADAGRSADKPFDQLLQRIDMHLSSHFASESVPYREAILSVKKKVDAASKGHIPPAPPPAETTDNSSLAAGRPAPDLDLTDLTSGRTVSLAKMRGLPVVMLWYQPTSARTAEPVLRFAQDLYVRYGDKAFILPMAIGDSDGALAQRASLKLGVHVLAGRGANKIHGITSAPCFVVIDGNGVARSITLGWSDANAESVRVELEKRLK